MTARFLLFTSLFILNIDASYSQEEVLEDTMNTEMVDTTMENTTKSVSDISETEEKIAPKSEINTNTNPSFHQVLKTKFIEGGAGFMGIVLLTLILGLALCIERIIYLHAAGSTDNEELLGSIEKA